jgi:signal transduction histidine kinase/CheY-like chemotaxis protein
VSLLDPADDLERQNAKLHRIVESLMRRVEQSPDHSSLAYAQFERASLLEEQVRQRTAELERTLDLLQESNARLSEAMVVGEAARSNLTEAIETVDEGFALFDADDRLVLHNSRFCEDLDDVSPGLAPGLTFERYVDLVSRSRHLELPADQTPADWRKVRMRHHTDSRTTFNVSLSLDRWMQVSERRTAAGGTVILQTDVTQIIRLERRERDRLMDRQAKMTRATLDHLAQGVAIFDRDGRLIGWNAQMEALLERPVALDIVGLPFAELLDRLDDDFTFTGKVDRAGLEDWAARRPRRRALTLEVERANDRVYSVHAQEMPDRGFVISFTDVTAERSATEAFRGLAATLERRVASRTEELGAALEEARRANASKARFMAAASHDLLQPLSAAKLFVATLEDRATDPDARDVAGKAVSALSSVETIIEALLDISRLDTGGAQFTIGRAALGPILESLRIEMTPLAAAKGLELRVVATDAVVESDPVLLRRVVQNLVANAIRYTDGRKILLGVRHAGDQARVEVIDQGPGIAPADQAVIFEEFRQLVPHRSGAAGLGLGLAIVDRACAALGHDLTLESVPGRGSRFAIAAPLRLGTPAIDAPAAPRGDLPDGLVVGLIENEPDLARAMTLMIEGWGPDVIHSESGEGMLALLEELGILPDVFLIDYQLGEGMDGLALIAELRARFPTVQAAIVSADRSGELAQRCAAMAVERLPKPLDPGRLQRVLSALAPA